MSGATTPARGVAEAAVRELEKQLRVERLARAAAVARGEDPGPRRLRRIRAARRPDGEPAVDLSKADPDCKRCGGGGRLKDQPVKTRTGEMVPVPVICRCVHRRGGVAPDMLDRMLAHQTKPRR